MDDDAALEQVVWHDLQERSSAEIACAYRALCAAMLLRTAMVVRSKCPPRKVEVDQRRTALNWIGKTHGTLSFRACCEALDMAPDAAENAIWRYARGEGGEAISRVRFKKPHSRMVFGRKRNAPSQPVLPRQDSDADRLAPCPATGSGCRSRTGWTRQGGGGDQAPAVRRSED